MTDFKAQYREKLEERKKMLNTSIKELYNQRQEALKHLDQVNGAILQAQGRLGEIDNQILELNADPVVNHKNKVIGKEGK